VPLLTAKDSEALAHPAEARRGQAPLRLFMALVLAIGFRVQLDDPLLWGWLSAYLAAEVFELWALWPFRLDKPAPPTWRAGVGVFSMFTMAAAFGAIALPLWLAPGSLGPAGSVLLLAGSILNVLIMSRRSPLAFIAGVLPYVAYLMSAPLIDRAARGADPFSLPFLLAELLFLCAALMIYSAAERMADNEARQHAELDARRDKAEAEVSAKSAFIATVSHELRTPLTAILAASTDLQRQESALSRERGVMIADAARMMRALLDDLLDLTKLEARRMRVESVAFDPRRLMRDVLGFWNIEAQRKGLFLALTGEADLPLAAHGDPLRLRQILNNLISNAVKFTDRGGVTLEVEASDAPGGATFLSVTVADTGPGLTDEQLSRLFTPFDQTDDSIARTHGGTGLGLAISRELARLMGGDLTAANGPRGGARFTFQVRLQRAAAPTPAPRREVAAANISPGVRPPRILVVDDHPIGRKAMTVLLDPLGAQVSEAESGEAALDALSVERFDLVLMDLTMAGIGGHEAARRLRSRPGPNRGVPMLAVSGLTGRDDVATCLAAGMNGCVAKPLEPAALYAAIERVLTGKPDPALETPEAATAAA
jgi:signal transduction histidine kinase/ActR/RegA family two-component response regulator